MKKNLFYLFALICSMSLFTACSDDDDPDYSKVIEGQIAGTYKGTLNVDVLGTTTTTPQNVTVEQAGATAVNLIIKNFSFSGLSLGDITLPNCELTQEGTKYTCERSETITLATPVGTVPVQTGIVLENGTVTVSLDITWTSGSTEVPVTVKYDGERLKGDESGEAKILDFSFDKNVAAVDSLVTGVTIDEATKSISITVVDTIKTEHLKALVPTIQVSAGATLSPASGVAADFTAPVKYTVVAENGTAVEYTASVVGNKYDFENWVAGVEGQAENMTFYEPSGWSSSNTGAHFLKAFGLADSYVVRDTVDAHSGSKAALVQSIDTKGRDLWLAKAPKVTTGSLFLGKFITDVSSTLNSTKFGIPYVQKPVALKGWYKYTPGEEYYIVNEEPYADHCHEAVLDETKVDEFAISVVLYETEEYDLTDWSDCLTGVADAENNIYTSSRIAAIAQLTGGEQTEWTSFELNLEWKKTYDASKKYRMTIACSSSKDGDKFWGAPGSTLTVDDFELVTE